LSWEQLWLVPANATRRDRLLLLLDMTGALRPGELFVLRWRSFNNRNTLSITETVYRRVIRPFGKTKKSLGKVHLPDGLARELLLWKAESPNPSPDAFLFPNADGGFLDVGNYRYRVLKPLAELLGIPKLTFQVLRRTMATQAQNMGSVKDIQAHLRPEGGHDRQRVHAGAAGERAGDGWIGVRDAGERRGRKTGIRRFATKRNKARQQTYR
jgi:integrase